MEQLDAALQECGFTSAVLWASSNVLEAQGDPSTASVILGQSGRSLAQLTASTQVFRRILNAQGGGSVAMDLLGEDGWSVHQFPELMGALEKIDLREPRTIYLFLAPYDLHCGFCVALAREDVAASAVDRAHGAVARHFRGLLADAPRPADATDTYADRFSARERDVLRWCAEGKTNWEVSGILGISENTVRFHLKKAFRKLDATTRSSAVSAALMRGVIEPARGPRKAALTEMYRSFVEGDAAPLRALLADDVVLVATAPKELFPHAGRYHGPDGVLAHAAAVDRDYECKRFFPRVMVEDGDVVAVYLDVELVHRETKRSMGFDCAHFWTFRGDKVVHYVELFNTAHAASQMAPPDDADLT